MPFTAGVVQAAPVWLDHDATVEKSIALLEEAADQDAELVVFPESWLPGYPMWVWFAPPMASMDLLMRYRANAAEADGAGVRAIADAAARLGQHVVLGMAEREGGSLYCTQLVLDDRGEVAGRHRKLKPTHAERMVWGEGDGAGLAVVDTPHGRLGALNCWENIQPLVKMAMFSQGEQLHALSWPSFCILEAAAPALGATSARAVNQAYALEGQCWVLASSAVFTQEMLDQFVPADVEAPIAPGGGHSMVVAPDSTVVTELLGPTDEGVVTAVVDLGANEGAKAVADPTGHYGRPDVVQLLFDRSARPVTVVAGSTPGPTPQAEASRDGAEDETDDDA